MLFKVGDTVIDDWQHSKNRGAPCTIVEINPVWIRVHLQNGAPAWRLFSELLVNTEPNIAGRLEVTCDDPALIRAMITEHLNALKRIGVVKDFIWDEHDER